MISPLKDIVNSRLATLRPVDARRPQTPPMPVNKPADDTIVIKRPTYSAKVPARYIRDLTCSELCYLFGLVFHYEVDASQVSIRNQANRIVIEDMDNRLLLIWSTTLLRATAFWGIAEAGNQEDLDIDSRRISAEESLLIGAYLGKLNSKLIQKL